MCPKKLVASILITSLALIATGCNRALHFENTISMGPGDVKEFSVDPPRSEQKVTIAFASSTVPVRVYVTLANNLESASKAIQNYKTPEGILGKQENAKEGSIDVVIPAKTPFGVIVAGAIKDTTVQFKMNGK